MKENDSSRHLRWEVYDESTVHPIRLATHSAARYAMCNLKLEIRTSLKTIYSERRDVEAKLFITASDFRFKSYSFLTPLPCEYRGGNK